MQLQPVKAGKEEAAPSTGISNSCIGKSCYTETEYYQSNGHSHCALQSHTHAYHQVTAAIMGFNNTTCFDRSNGLL